MTITRKTFEIIGFVSDHHGTNEWGLKHWSVIMLNHPFEFQFDQEEARLSFSPAPLDPSFCFLCISWVNIVLKGLLGDQKEETAADSKRFPDCGSVPTVFEVSACLWRHTIHPSEQEAIIKEHFLGLLTFWPISGSYWHCSQADMFILFMKHFWHYR